jgi:Exo70 exocyst complex subunit
MLFSHHILRWKLIVSSLSSNPDEAPKTHALPSRDKLKQFQASFGEACECQKHLLLSDPELLSSVRSQVKELVLKEFITFYNLNPTLFGMKATSQLDPERVEQVLGHLFESQ